ncbi:MAG: phospholipid/cholesterol/gamma-HCH transport system substrate-binding protein [Mycobacterium sp.]|nr:phospholipid/cholesterol/gamma-HCH transport system substrate-binding protein [Mycobacterium sp.]
MNRRGVLIGTAALLVLLLAGGAGFVVRQTFFKPTTITAVFTAARGIYPGDEVRISGVKVGTITGIDAAGTQAKVTMNVDRDVRVPVDAKAVIVAQNVVAARYMQLAPAYEGGPLMRDGAVIPIERTAVPVEWDEVKKQLVRLATDLGPDSATSTSSAGRFIDSAANAMDGNGDKLRQTLAQLSQVGRILADGSNNIVDIITNLQTFVTALRDSKVQIVQFEGRLATLSSVVADSKSDLDAAVVNLSQAVGEVQRFIAGTRDKTSEQVQRLADVTQNLVDHRKDVEQVLHVAPNAAVNAYNMYDPQTGTVAGNFVINNFANPVQFLCSAIGAIENATAAETGKLCEQYLGPALRLITINNVPMPTNPFLAKAPGPEDLIYSDPALAPDGAGPVSAPEPLPTVSAYIGAGDVPPPAGFVLPPVPDAPPPAAPGPKSLQDMMLPPVNPAGGQPAPPPPPPGNSLNGVPLPVEAPLPSGGTP